MNLPFTHLRQQVLRHIGNRSRNFVKPGRCANFGLSARPPKRKSLIITITVALRVVSPSTRDVSILDEPFSLVLSYRPTPFLKGRHTRVVHPRAYFPHRHRQPFIRLAEDKPSFRSFDLKCLNQILP